VPVALPYLPAPRVPTVYRQAPVRPVADASGAPVLRDQGPIGLPGTARPIPSPRMGMGGTGLHWVTLRH
jgi:hypothetical protein